MARGLAENREGWSRPRVPVRAGVADASAMAHGRTPRRASRLAASVALLLVTFACTSLLLGSSALAAGASSASSKASSPNSKTPKPKRPKRATSPTISGKPEDGQLLTAENGTWRGTEPITYTYQWDLCTERTCTAIPGATETTYRADTAEIGHFLRVLITAHNVAGQTTTHSKNTKRIVEGPPVSSALPVITGTPIVGQTLEASTGEWFGTPPFRYHYQWLSCNVLGECLEIAGATGSTYTVEPLETASAIEVVVTASNSAGSESATSEETDAVSALLPKDTELPSVAGSLIDGQLLNAVPGSWEGSTPISYGYEWELCNSSGAGCSVVSEATAATLSLISTDVGKTVRVVVTATNSAGSASATSEASSVVAALLPSNSGLPSVSGSLVDGQVLSAVTGSWKGTTPISYGYEWELCNSSGAGCSVVSEATAATLSLISTDVGKTVRVVVTATNSAGSASATSEASSVVAALLPSNSGLPSVSGSLVDGQVLSAVTGSWKGTTPISYGYEWEMCNSSGAGCSVVSEATAATLSLISTDVGKTVRVVVTATNSAGSASATSEASSVVAALLPSNTELPKILGSLLEGQILKAASGTWTGTPTITYTYQWQDCGLLGEEKSCANISNVTNELKLEVGDVGLTFRVVVTATNAAGSSSKASSITELIKL